MSGNNRPMLSDRSIEMINLVIDGEATPQERAEVQDLLSGSPDAREFDRSMRELAQAFDAMPSAPAPGVKAEVLAELRARSAPVVQFPAAQSRRRLVLGLAWAAAAILVIIVSVDRLLVWDARVSPEQAAARMAPKDVESWPEFARVTSEKAQLIVRSSNDRYSLLVVARQPGTVTIRWDDQKLTLVDGNPTGLGKATLVLQRRPGTAGSAVVTVLLEGEPLLQTSIPVN